jgi:thiol-disulfide isomerase/thioredoxin
MKKIFWILILILIIIIIYYIYNCNDNIEVIRKIKNKKYYKSKKIYVSPNIKKCKPIKKMKNKLTKKLKKISEEFTNVNNTKHIIKLYFAEWCPHCVDFLPIWTSIKNKYNDNIIFVEIDCTNNSPQLEYVQGFPSIVLFDSKDNYIENYEKERSIISFESYIKNKI